MSAGVAESEAAVRAEDEVAPSAVRLHAVHKSYGEVRAVDGIDVDVRKGEFLTLLGPSGCGKTTTLRLIGGFERPDSGRIEIDGEDVTMAPPYKREVTTVFQQYALFPHLNVRKNIEYGLRHAKVGAEETRSRVDEMMRLMEISGMDDRRPRQLSGGQQQRVALARALVMRPKVLLLDEPLGSLDYKLRKGMQFELKRIHREVGATFIYVTHDQEEAMTMSDRIIVMRDGHIEQNSSPEEIFDRPHTPFVADFIGDTNLVEGIVREADEGSATVDLGDLGVVRGSCADAVQVGMGAQVSIRPSDVRLVQASDGGAVVTDAVLAGSHVAMKLSGGGSEIVAHVGRNEARLPGERVRVEIDSNRIRIFGTGQAG